MRWIKTVLVLAPMALMSSPLLAEDPPASAPAKVEVIDFRKLKEVIPETLGGLKRSDLSGEKNSFGEFAMSMASAEFGEGDKTISLQITDYGSNNPMMAIVGQMGAMQMDRETETGYEKSVKIEGNPGIEHYDNDDKSGGLTLFVGGRFLIQLETNGLTSEELQQVIGQLPVAKVAALK